MREITCDLPICGLTTYLIDERYTLDSGWAAGVDLNMAAYYVCPTHVARYTLTPVPSVTLVPTTAPPAEPEAPTDGG